jgi:hypothetical protein
MLALANGYRRRNEREILELAAIASDIGLGDVTTFGLEPDANPQLLEAFKLQYKNVDPESLVGRSEEELQGFISGVKGKYFEVLIKDRLNSGETLGELRLEPGQVARLADLPNQQGWDLEIVDHQGDPVDLIQAKATVSIAPVREALRENPDIQVAVPDNLDNASPDVLGTDISWDDLSAEAEAHIGEMSEGAMANALQSTAELGIDVIPVGSVLLIGVVEGRRYLMGEATLRESMRTGAGRLPRAMAYSGIGTALAATGLGVAAIPAVMGLRVAQTRVSAQVNLGDNLESRTTELGQLATRIRDPE